MEIKNGLSKGTVLDVIYENGRYYLVGTNCLDITDRLSNKEKGEIAHLGKALALVVDERTINIVEYVQFHVHSEYSILDGMSKLSDIATKSSGITAITDHGNAFSILKWQKAMHKAGKKALFGEEAYIETINGEKKCHHILFLAKNETGKKNLFFLSSNAFYDMHRKPHVTIENLKKYHEGLICTSACLGGEIASTIATDYESAKQVALFYKELFKDDYYLEIQRHGTNGEKQINELIIQLARELDIKLVAANDSHYIDKEDAKYHEILLCINTGSSLNNPHFKFDGSGYWYKTDSEMIQDFWDIPEAITNTYEIAKKCNLEIKTGVYHFPKFAVPEPFMGEESFLLHLIDKGFKERYEGTPMYTDQTYLQRLEYEKNIVLSMGFAGYFLIVWDYVNYAKSHGIMVGPGRGSAAGSLVCYCLKITDLDPIQYSLLFERFLNPERMSMPDIDMDFEYERRQEVIDYVKQKYGADRVCNIITFGTMGAKMAVKDVARVTNDYAMGNMISSMIPNSPNTKIKATLKENQALKNAYDGDSTVREVIDTAIKLEGNARQTSVHACGIVVSDDSIKNYLPTALVKDTNDKNNKILVSQVTMTEVEELGLLKMDFLGLRTMSVIGRSVDTINLQRTANGLTPYPYYRTIPINDPYVYADISEGKSFAVFQIESDGMRGFMSDLFKDVKARIAGIEDKYQLTGFGEKITGSGFNRTMYENEMNCLGDELFERMIAGISLYRPGPMDYIPDYINGITHPETITYDVPELEPILSPTYGVIVYQEQVMEIVRVLAGFSMGQADTVRKAMGKKKQEILDEYCPYFINGSGENIDEHTGNRLNIAGCVQNGISKETAEGIWDKMKEFAKYAFNKSHAAVYAVLTVTCAYIKHYYPEIYMCSIANSYIDNTEKLRGYISVAKNMDIVFLSPSVNMSESDFILENNQIRFGLKGIKGLSNNVEKIIQEREKGSFTSMQNFIERTSSFINKKNLEALIYAGAFDEFGGTRSSKIAVLETMLKYANSRLKDKSSGQMFLFDYPFADELKIEIPDVKEYPKQKKLSLEKEYSGLYISEHPLDEYKATCQKLGCSEISLLVTDETADEPVFNRTNATIAGIITSVDLRTTKKDKKTMAVFKIEDRSAEIKCVVFPKEYNKLSPLLKKGNIVVVNGEVNNDENFGLQILVRNVLDINTIVYPGVSTIYVKLDNLSQLTFLETLVRGYTGNVPVKAQIDRKLYPISVTALASSTLYVSLQNHFGYNNVLYK